MSLLARNAEQFFWLGRYIERAASISRIIEIHSAHDRGGDADLSWGWLVALYSDEALFKKSHAEFSFKNVIRFYVSDGGNPGSVASALRAARENARALRAVIPTEMWNHLNQFHNRFLELDERDLDLICLSRTCGTIKNGCYAQLGVIESTLYRDEGERFFRLGLMIERADQTSRLLDVKFAQLATRATSNAEVADATFWALVLRSAAAYQAFRRLERKSADPASVARFLLLNPCHPKSVACCATEIQRVLQELRSGYGLRQTSYALEKLDVLVDGLEHASRDASLVTRLHDINDWLQLRLADLTNELAIRFFGAEPPQQQSQSQSQSVA